MQNEQSEPAPLISEFLFQIRDELSDGSIAVSDALISVARVCRMVFTEARIVPLTRELLGYSEEETRISIDAIKLLIESSADACFSSVPSHRMINGFAVPVLALLHQASINARTRVTQELRFCDQSATELELMLKQAQTSKSPYVVLEFNEDVNTAFLCRTKDVDQMLLSMRRYVQFQIDNLLNDLTIETSESENVASQAA